MKSTKLDHYQTVARAITYIRAHYKEQPSLATIAQAVNLSPHHLQRTFTEWAGISPKKFSQYLSLDHAKRVMVYSDASVETAALSSGLSGSGRLHDLFVNIEAMTPGQFKRGAQSLVIRYRFVATQFGDVLAAATPIGICHLQFFHSKPLAIAELKAAFPKAELTAENASSPHPALEAVQQFFQGNWNLQGKIHLHISGTPFQLKVWQSLLSIPSGSLTSYGKLAKDIKRPSAARAIGSAVGKNPVAILIPCHRVIQASGGLGGYRWGEDRKAAIIGWEGSQP